MKSKVKVAIIEDQKEIREMLVRLINSGNVCECIGTFENAEEAVKIIPVLKPDVVMVDIHLPGQSGIDCITQLIPLCKGMQFVMCTSLEDNDTIFKALKAGANGYLTKSTAPDKIIEAILDVYNGGSPMSSQIARKVVGAFRDNKPKKPDFEELSKREQEILELLSKGLRYKEISVKLFVSVETVRTHIRNIYQKLQVNSRTEAINKVFNRD
jgi:DNA-binding NarL/FixJ family response regulator